MGDLQSYILVLGQSAEDCQWLYGLPPERLQCSVMVVSSLEEAVQQVNQAVPCLLILAGGQSVWHTSIVQRFRSLTNDCGMTIVVVSESHAPRWTRQDNSMGIDGYLVKPITGEILNSLIQSAWARQVCCTLQRACPIAAETHPAVAQRLPTPQAAHPYTLPSA
ncbi:hypothetical protein [Trichothermofontia sp.]